MNIHQLPLEVIYIILDYLSFEDKANVRLVNRSLRKAASYIFREINMRNRSDVQYFSQVVQQTPDIGAHVRSIKVRNAAILRALNSSHIKRACFNVNSIDITDDQGRGNWSRSLHHYPRLQQVPILEDDTNAQEALTRLRLQLSTLKLGGPLLVSFTIPQLTALLDMMPNVKTLCLFYPFNQRLNDIYQDLKGSLTFDHINNILNRGSNLNRLELQYCEIANVSLLGLPPLLAPEEASDLRASITASSLAAQSGHNLLFRSCNTLTHIKMDHIAVVSISEFLRSMLDSFIHLKNVDIEFLPRFTQLDESFREWDTADDNSDVWSPALGHVSKLKTLKLKSMQKRLNMPALLLMLGNACAPLEELTLVGLDNNINATMSCIFEQFSATVRRLTFHLKHQVTLAQMLWLDQLEYFDIQWTRTRFETQIQTCDILTNAHNLQELRFGYENSVPVYDTCRRITNTFPALTKINLSRLSLTERDLRNLFLPLVNLKEAIFEQCVFNVPKPNTDNLNIWNIDNREMYDQSPGVCNDMEKQVRHDLFQLVEYDYDTESHESEYPYPWTTDDGDDEASDYAKAREHLPDLRNYSVREIRNKLRYLKEENGDNLQLRSLSLQHLGLHDCKLRPHGQPFATAKTIRNFEVILDARSKCNKITCIDRAFHEKKACNPHIVVNKVKRTAHNIRYHFTHEFGGSLGKNNYQQSRPTFRIRMFSLDKFSIRPKCLMSIYFKDTDESRLTTCNQYLKTVTKKMEEAPSYFTTSMLIAQDLKAAAQRRDIEPTNTTDTSGNHDEEVDSMDISQETVIKEEVNNKDGPQDYDIDLEVNPYAMKAVQQLVHEYHMHDHLMIRKAEVKGE